MPYYTTDEAYLKRKQNIATDLASRQMQELHWQIRERAFWSATVDNAKIVADLHDVCNAVVSERISVSDARLEIAKSLNRNGYKPSDGTQGTIRDLSSFRRQDLIIQTNVEMARGYAHYAEAQEDLHIYPCQELIRERKSRFPRNWENRWLAAGGKLYGGRMVAEINSPIWRRISRFNLPYPPFDFNSGMGLMPVGIEEALKLGVIPNNYVPAPVEIPSINEALEANLPIADALKKTISQKMKGFAKWNGDKLLFADPNGTKPYSETEIVEVLKNPLPDNFYADGKSPYHQRDALIEWTNNSNYIKHHTTSDKAYHFGRLLKRIKPMNSDTPVYRGMSWNLHNPKQKEAFDSFMAQVENGYYERATFESYSKSLKVAEDFGERRVAKVVITVKKHKTARDISYAVKEYNKTKGDEAEVVFSQSGKMRIVKMEKPEKDVFYLTVEESQ